MKAYFSNPDYVKNTNPPVEYFIFEITQDEVDGEPRQVHSIVNYYAQYADALAYTQRGSSLYSILSRSMAIEAIAAANKPESIKLCSIADCTVITEYSAIDSAQVQYSQCIDGERYSGMTYSETIFRHCDFTGVDFSNCKFNSCRFIHCTLQNTNFSNCEFPFSRFSHCDLTNANFSDSSLGSARFVYCGISAMRLHNANLDSTEVFDCVGTADYSNTRISNNITVDYAPAITIHNPLYIVQIYHQDQVFRMGCQTHKIETWEDFDLDDLQEIDSDVTEDQRDAIESAVRGLIAGTINC